MPAAACSIRSWRTRPRNPVVIGGDRHAFFAADLKRDFARPDEATIATEFVGTSITSDGPGPAAHSQCTRQQRRTCSTPTGKTAAMR